MSIPKFTLKLTLEQLCTLRVLFYCMPPDSHPTDLDLRKTILRQTDKIMRTSISTEMGDDK